MPTWADIQSGIFAGESGGDYGALYGFSNRPGKMFSDVDVTGMSINELLDFQSPRGPYAQYVGGLNEGVVSSPAGAYQIVGRTLRDARDRMGLTGGEQFTPEMQDRIGRWIYDQQGTGAWEGYQDPQGGDMAYTDQPTQQGGLLSMPEPSRGDKRRDMAGRAAMFFNELRQRPSAAIPQMVQGRRDERKSNRTAEWLRQQPGGEQFAAMIGAGATGAQALQAYQSGMATSANVQSSQPLPDGSGVMMVMRDGNIAVRTAGNELLSGQDAVDFVKSSGAAYLDHQRQLYGSREAGKVTIEMAQGAIERLGNVGKNIGNYDAAIAAIDGGAASGAIMKYLPDITTASATLTNTMNQLGLDVISSVTFGALSEAEMKLAMETAVPRNLSPIELRKWLVEKRDAQINASEALYRAATFLSNPKNTLEDWVEESKPQAQPTPAPSGGLSEDELKYLEID